MCKSSYAAWMCVWVVGYEGDGAAQKLSNINMVVSAFQPNLDQCSKSIEVIDHYWDSHVISEGENSKYSTHMCPSVSTDYAAELQSCKQDHTPMQPCRKAQIQQRDTDSCVNSPIGHFFPLLSTFLLNSLNKRGERGGEGVLVGGGDVCVLVHACVCMLVHVLCCHQASWKGEGTASQRECRRKG